MNKLPHKNRKIQVHVKLLLNYVKHAGFEQSIVIFVGRINCDRIVKKGFSIGLTVFMVVATIGITVNKHYSGGELYSVALFGEADSCCEVPCDCCHEESETHQLKENFIGSSFEVVKVFVAKIADNVFHELFNDLSSFDNKAVKYYTDKSPPPLISSEEKYTQNFLL